MQVSTRSPVAQHRLVAISCVAACALLLAGCSPTARHDARATDREDHAGSTAVTQQDTPSAAPAAPAAAPLPPADLALRLESLLGQHSMLASDMMRGRIRGNDDFAQAANSALGKNTDAMVNLVSANFGAPAASQFRTQWSAHVAALFTYAQGLAEHSDTLRDQAKATLVTFERELAGFFATASQGRLNRDAAQAAILMHVDHLLQQADAYAAQDYATSDRIYHEGYVHTYDLGRTLAGALLPPDQAKALSAPTWRLRSELSKLLGEHVVLVVDATRSSVMNASDFKAAADALNGNTTDLAGAIDTLFGKAAATSFQSLWADHVDNIMAYTAAVVSHDDKRRDAALAKLKDFETQFASFLDSATQRRLNSGSLANALVMHDDMLLKQADAFATKQYQQAHDIADSTYSSMFDLSGQLADGFGAAVAARLPAGGAETGLGGMAGVPGR
jgi:hypothetical protein